MTDRIMLVIKKKCFKLSVINGNEGCTCWNYGRCTSPNAFCELKTEPVTYYPLINRTDFKLYKIGAEEEES